MNKGIEILLARMESSPEEFLTGNKSGKWLHLMEQYEDYMEPEDRKVLMDKYNSLKMQKFTEKVMKELLEDQQEKNEAFGNYAQNLAASMQQTKNNIAQAVFQNQCTAQQRMQQAQLAQQNALNQAGALGMSSGGQIYMTNAAGSIQPLANTSASPVTTEIHLGKQTLTEKTLKKLKALIK